MANIITGIRMGFSVVLLICPAFSCAFYVLYLAAGLTDMIDGTVARKTNTASAFGSKLDSIADFFFVAVCLIKMLPSMDISVWFYLWIAGIAAIKLVNFVLGAIRQRKLMAVHSVLNKVTGGLLFLLPLMLPYIDLQFGAMVVCLVATVAAFQEGYLILTMSPGV